MKHKEFVVGEVALDPFHIGTYGYGAFIVTKVENKERFGEQTQLLDVTYLDAEADGESYNDFSKRGMNGTNTGRLWANSVKVRFNSTVSVDAKRIKATHCSLDRVDFEVLEYHQ